MKMLMEEFLVYILRYTKSKKTIRIEINDFIKWLFYHGVNLSPFTVVYKLEHVARKGFVRKAYKKDVDPMWGLPIKKRYYIANTPYIEYYLYHNAPQFLSEEERASNKKTIKSIMGFLGGR